MFGDVVGRVGRHAMTHHLPKLMKEHEPDFVIANGENAAGGFGITSDTALPLFNSGVDVITLGNHVWAQRDVAELLDREPRIIRPANVPPGLPGRGSNVFTTKTGIKIGVINLLGRTFMIPVDDPFRTADAHIAEISEQTNIIIIDFHAEATSEKGALAWDLDGKVSAVIGTHTHIPTCDSTILPNGTAFQTDAGMVGPRDSVLGMKVETVVQRFRTQMQNKFEVAGGPAVINGVVIEIDESTGHAESIERIRIVEN